MTKQVNPYDAYYCGYPGINEVLVRCIFDDARKIVELNASTIKNHTSDDVLMAQAYGPCAPVGVKKVPGVFNGRILYFNGEAHPMYPLDSRDGLYALGHDQDSDKTIRVYFGAAYLGTLSFEAQRSIYNVAHKPRNDQSRFLVYAASHCVPYREQAFSVLSQIGQTYFGGKCSGSSHTRNAARAVELQNTTNWPDNAKLFRSYRFALVMENRKQSGYITEKIFNAFLSGAIPIWYGTEEIFDIFNAEAFIYWDIDNPQAAIRRVRYLEHNRSAYDQVLRAPILRDGERTVERFFSFNKEIGSGKLRTRIRKTMNFTC